MAVVLQSEDDRYFVAPPLRRSHSQPKFGSKSASFHSTAPTRRINESYSREPVKIYPDSVPSSAPSSPQAINAAESSDLSYVSTPASTISLSTSSDCDDTLRFPIHADDHFVLPDFPQDHFPQDHFSQDHFSPDHFLEPTEDLEPPTSPRTGHSYTVSPSDNDISASTSRPETPEIAEHAEDDTAIKIHPTRHVDYLSHEWTEEEIWSSWRYIVSRRGEYPNAARLENASWRQWLKAKYKLRTVSPETLNWLKDCDVTWLYGPIQGARARSFDEISTAPNTSRLSKSNSFIHKKPILKKRSMSEVMLQRSISTSSLLKQATAAVVAQEKDGRRIGRPGLDRANTDFGTFPFSSRRMSKDTSLLTSTASSGLISPMSGRKRIHFNEKVEQCIAVDIKGDEDEDDYSRNDTWDSDSDDGAIMMKRSRVSKKRVPVIRRKSTSNVNTEGKIIAKLPSTTLKCRDEEECEPETAMKHSTKVYRSPIISPSSSQETLRGNLLRPSKPSGKFLLGDSDDEDSADSDSDDNDEHVPLSLGQQAPKPKQKPKQKPVPSSQEEDAPVPAPQGLGLKRTASTNSLTAEPEGMRRTPSGMFMPLEEGDASTNEGIFGRVIDTVNTARDIAHVIWNVGWRK